MTLEFHEYHPREEINFAHAFLSAQGHFAEPSLYTYNETLCNPQPLIKRVRSMTMQGKLKIKV